MKHLLKGILDYAGLEYNLNFYATMLPSTKD